MTELYLPEPIPLSAIPCTNGIPVEPGCYVIVSIIDLRLHEGESFPDGKPFITVLHELPERARRWKKYHPSLAEATLDAQVNGILPAVTAMTRVTTDFEDPAYTPSFVGRLIRPSASLMTFEFVEGTPVGTWDSLHQSISTIEPQELRPLSQGRC